MTIKVYGGGSVDGFLYDPVDWSNVEADLEKVIFVTSGTELRSFVVETTDAGLGNQLANGYFANATEVQGVIAEANNALALNGKPTATTAEAIAGNTDKIPDVIGVHAAFNEYGVGAVKVLPSGTSPTDLSIKQGDYYLASTNDTPNTGISVWYLDVKKTTNENFRKIEITGASPSGGVIRKYMRLYNNGVWQDYVEVTHSRRLNSAQNLSGSTVASNSTIAGASLSPSRVGTWRNVSGNDIVNNGYGLWELV